MYIWTAIDVDAQLQGLRRRTEEIAEALGAENPALTLPLHISLRISFPVKEEDFDRAIESIGRYFGTLTAFPIAVGPVERFRTVVWLRAEANDALRKIHADLLKMMREELDVPPHPLDAEYLYHATLYMGDDGDILQRVYDAVRDADYPAVLTASRAVIGSSRSGKAGEYAVLRTFALPEA